MLRDLFASTDEKLLRKYQKIADQIEKKEAYYGAMSDDELISQTDILKKRLIKESIEDILVDAYAVVREAAWRTLKEKPFYVQLVGGIALHYGDVAEMKTGEGKTLTAILPVYLNALSGNGVHVITVNEYLAARDAEWMGTIYRFLGLTVGCNLQNLSFEEKKQAYNSDITYTTNSELGFDYLRDNMAISNDSKVQRGLYFALIDEVDSVLIDESRTPLIISGWGAKLDQQYYQADFFVKKLKSDEFEINKDEQTVELTSSGIERAENFFQVEHLFVEGHEMLVHFIKNALRANYIMRKDVDYMIKDNELALIDQFTGRKMEGREYSDGLHQAIQAKENIEIKQETQTLATITYQNFFRLYSKLSGMTGTAKTEESEFLNTYNMRVIPVPTNKPIKRIDYPDTIVKTKGEKYRLLIDEIKENYNIGRPVLVGTISVENSETISELLKKENIMHSVLNAKNDAEEAKIVEKAGQFKSVTIATNMAGRGTDIKLTEETRELGGLVVLGLERHESQRIDNQLRGRSGRQGDPGYSRFYVSTQDDLLRKFPTDHQREQIDDYLNGKLSDEKMHSLVNAIQKTAENLHEEQRKHVLEFDDVLMEQRKIIYTQRDEVLDMENVSHIIEKMFIMHITDVEEQIIPNDNPELYAKEICRHFEAYHINEAELSNLLENSKKKSKDILIEMVLKTYHDILASSKIAMENYEKRVLLSTLDRLWRDHVDFMDKLKKGINLRSYGNVKPIEAYKNDGYEEFDNMLRQMRLEVTSICINAKFDEPTFEEVED